MKWVFPEEIILFRSEKQVVTRMYVHLLSCARFSFLLSCFLTEAKLRVIHTD